MIRWILKIILGVEINRSNLNLSLSSILSCTIVIIITYVLVIYFDLFSIIENLFAISKQPWYSEIFAKFSFLMISIKIFFLSLFTKLNNPLGRLKIAFIYQFTALIGGVLMNLLLNEFILSSEHIPSIAKIILMALPYTLSVVMFFQMRRIYTDTDFHEDKYLQK